MVKSIAVCVACSLEAWADRNEERKGSGAGLRDPETMSTSGVCVWEGVMGDWAYD